MQKDWQVTQRRGSQDRSSLNTSNTFRGPRPLVYPLSTSCNPRLEIGQEIEIIMSVYGKGLEKKICDFKSQEQRETTTRSANHTSRRKASEHPLSKSSPAIQRLRTKVGRWSFRHVSVRRWRMGVVSRVRIVLNERSRAFLFTRPKTRTQFIVHEATSFEIVTWSRSGRINRLAQLCGNRCAAMPLSFTAQATAHSVNLL